MENPSTTARFYEKTQWDNVSCRLCPHQCSIAPSRTGTCGVRTNRGGELQVDNYGRITSLEGVYSEDLPLFHYKPEIDWLRLSGKGCTMRCPFCNTFRYSQTGGIRATPLSPRDAVARAIEARCRGISFGVNEPAPMHEYVFDVFTLARAAGLSTHLATSGMWMPDPFREILSVTDAVTLGLKGTHERFYQTYLGADKPTILANLDQMLALRIHTEIAWLTIPSLTDQVSQAQELVAFLRSRGVAPPILLVPYEPDFTWSEAGHGATLQDLVSFKACFDNYPGPRYCLHPESLDLNTRCAQCGRTLIRRGLARAVVTTFPQTGKAKDQCPGCGAKVPYTVDIPQSR